MEMSMYQALRRFLFAFLLSHALFACGESSDDEAPAADAVRILHFTASPGSLEPGEEALLSWETSKATKVEIRDTDGGLISIPPGQDGLPQIAKGEVSVHLAHTTTYILTATGKGGSVTQLARVEVRGSDPDEIRVSLEADPGRIDAGGNAELRWEAANAQRIILRSGGEILVDDRERFSGALSVTPALTTTYEIEALGRGESVSAEVIVEVQPLIESFAVLTPGPVRPEIEVELVWSIQGASEAVLTSSDGFRYEVPDEEVSQGTLRTAAGNGTFRLTAKSGALEARQEASVAVTEKPYIVGLEVGPPATASAEHPAKVTVSWTVAGADEVRIEAIPGGPQGPLPAGAESRGSLEATVTGPTAFRLVAENANGMVERTVQAEVDSMPKVLSFRALPERVGVGEQVELTWDVTGAASVSIHATPGGALNIDPSHTKGSVDLPVAENTSFVLTARNEVGYETHVFKEVSVGAPVVLDFLAPVRVSPGTPFDVVWRIQGGVELEILASAGDASACATRDLASIAEGRCAVVAPLGGDDFELTLSVKNGMGQGSSESRTINNHDGPIIIHFSASPDRITEAEETTLSWQVLEDLNGAPPQLVLRDSRGKTYDLPQGQASGEILSDRLPTGIHTFTLEASTPGTVRVDKLERQVQAFAKPLIKRFASNPSIVEEGVEFTDLEWQTEHAVQVQILPLDRRSMPLSPLYTENETAKVEEGAFEVRPTIRQREYRLIATNPVNFSVSQDVHIGFHPAEALTFTATPDVLFVGEETELEWTTRRAKRVTLDFEERWSEGFEPFIDLEGRPNARPLPLPSNNMGGTQIKFPEGFVFPFRGMLHDRATIMGYGYLSFYQKATLGTSRRPIPNDWAHRIHLAPFWTDLNMAGTAAKLLTELIEDEDGSRSVVIQWKGFGHSKDATARFDFQVVLHEDGSFDFRYGDMRSQQPDLAAGSDASIGFQDPRGVDYAQISNFAPVPGGLQGRAFHFPGLPMPLIASEIPEYFINVRTSGTATPISLPTSRDAGFTIHPLPDEFVFPFAGHDRTHVTVFRNGALSFAPVKALGNLGDDFGSAFPAPLMSGESNMRGMHLLPFLHDGSSSVGASEAWYDIVDLDGRSALIIQWMGMNLRGQESTSSLDFQVVLFEDGSFDYRYGLMRNTADQTRADGVGAYIGFQGGLDNISEGPSWGFQLLGNQAVSGGLSHRSWRFHQEPDFPVNGSQVLTPRGTTTYRLTAHNDHSSDSLVRKVTVHAQPEIQLWSVPAYPLPQQPFTLHWASKSIGSMVLLQEGQTVEQLPANRIASGSRAFAGLPKAIHDFSLAGTDLLGNPHVVELALAVGEPFSIETFDATPVSVNPLEPVTLQWTAEGTDSVRILASTGETYEGLNPLSGSRVVNPEVRTTYTLQALSMGRILEEERTVEVRSIRIDDFEPSTTEPVPVGGSVSFDWDQQGGSGASFTEVVTLEIEGPGSEYRDITQTGGQKTSWTGSLRAVTIPFPFPYFGNDYEVTGIGRGVLSLGDEEAPPSSTSVLPTFTSTIRPRMAPFWNPSSLVIQSPQGDSGVYTQHVDVGTDDEAFIIQWHNLRFNTPTSSTYSLNFQAVLFRNGDFDFRYGDMKVLNGGSTPATSENNAAGNLATVGYQESGGNGYQVWRNQAQDSGLSNRTWRTFAGGATIKPPLTIKPSQSDVYTICVDDGFHRECQQARVSVTKPGDLAITEVMVNPAEGEDGQWFEVRNVSPEPIDLNGATLRSGASTHTVNLGAPSYLLPGEFQVFSRTTQAGLPGDTYVYGTDFSIGAPAADGEVKVEVDGNVLGAAIWKAADLPPADHSAELNTSDHKRGKIERSLATAGAWCQAEETYAGAKKGSPGALGSPCPEGLYRVDLHSDRPFLDISTDSAFIPSMCSGNWMKGEIVGGTGFDFPFFDFTVAPDVLWAVNLGGATFTDLTPTPKIGAAAGDRWGVLSVFGTDRAGRMFSSYNSTIKDATGDNTQPMIGWMAPFWTDLGVGPSNKDCHFRYKHVTEGGVRGVVLEWSGFDFRQNQAYYHSFIEFQLQLWENGDIVYAYGNLRGQEQAFGVAGYGTLEDLPSSVAPGTTTTLNSRFIQTHANEPVLVPYSSVLFQLRNPPSP